jgi:hypothetical protein
MYDSSGPTAAITKNLVADLLDALGFCVAQGRKLLLAALFGNVPLF